MEKETLKNIFNFLEDEGGHKAPFKWKLVNNIPLTKEQLTIKGDLDLEFSKITSLPEGLKVEGDLRLLESEITSLPEGLRVGGYLSLAFTKITSLPKGLQVGGNLFIDRTNFTNFSDEEIRDMIKPGFVGGEIYRI